MTRRCFALVLALFVASAPLVIDVCQLVCAQAAHATTNTAENAHACHHAGIPSGTAISSAPHSCGHSDELPAAPTVAAAQAAGTTASPALPAARVTDVAAVQQAADPVCREAARLHPAKAGSDVPLRI